MQAIGYWLLQHFYPRSPCGERPATEQPKQQTAEISIHALLAESDRMGALTIFRA